MSSDIFEKVAKQRRAAFIDFAADMKTASFPSTDRAVSQRGSSAYPFVTLGEMERHVPAAKALGVSKVARSSRGFVTAYRRAGRPSSLSPYWVRRRDGFIARHLVQYKKAPTPRRWLALMMWAYKP